MKIHFYLGLFLLVSFVALNCSAATAPYAESFDGYATGDTAVTNFTEVSSGAWTIVSPSISGKGYEDNISAFSAGVGSAEGVNSSAGIDFPALASSSFSQSTLFRIDSLTLTGTNIANTALIGMFGRGADATPASSGSDRYQVSYFLDDDGAGHATGRLWLRENNLFFGDSLNIVSSASLPVTIGDTYQLTLSGTASGSSLLLSAILTDTTTSSSISVSKTDATNLLTGSNFGYLNFVYVQNGGTTALNVDFDNYSMVPEPAAGLLLLLGLAVHFGITGRGHR